MVGGLLFAARAASLAWRFTYVCAFGGFLLAFLITCACPTITSLCNKFFTTPCRTQRHRGNHTKRQRLLMHSGCLRILAIASLFVTHKRQTALCVNTAHSSIDCTVHNLEHKQSPNNLYTASELKQIPPKVTTCITHSAARARYEKATGPTTTTSHTKKIQVNNRSTSPPPTTTWACYCHWIGS